MFFLAPTGFESFGAFFDDKKGKAFRGPGEQRDEICGRPGGNKLLGTVYFITDDFTVVAGNRVGLGFDLYFNPSWALGFEGAYVFGTGDVDTARYGSFALGLGYHW